MKHRGKVSGALEKWKKHRLGSGVTVDAINLALAGLEVPQRIAEGPGGTLKVVTEKTRQNWSYDDLGLEVAHLSFTLQGSGDAGDGDSGTAARQAWVSVCVEGKKDSIQEYVDGSAEVDALRRLPGAIVGGYPALIRQVVATAAKGGWAPGAPQLPVLLLAAADGLLEASLTAAASVAVTRCVSTADAVAAFKEALGHRFPFGCVVMKLGRDPAGHDSWRPLVEAIKGDGHGGQDVFVVVHSATATQSATVRQECTDAGVNMVTADAGSLMTVIQTVSEMYIMSKAEVRTEPEMHVASKAKPTHPGALYKCPFCGLPNLPEDVLWAHCPLYHINTPNDSASIKPLCPVCKAPHQGDMQVHIRNAHGPPGRGEMHSESRGAAAPLYAFALALVRHPGTGQVLLVQEYGSM